MHVEDIYSQHIFFFFPCLAANKGTEREFKCWRRISAARQAIYQTAPPSWTLPKPFPTLTSAPVYQGCGLCTILCTGMADLRAVLHVQALFLRCTWSVEEAILLSFHFSVTDAFRKNKPPFPHFTAVYRGDEWGCAWNVKSKESVPLWICTLLVHLHCLLCGSRDAVARDRFLCDSADTHQETALTQTAL